MTNFIILLLLSLTITLSNGCNNDKSGFALGTLERERVAHTATVNEIITALPVKAGSQVTQGTLLMQLGTTIQQAALAKSNAQMLHARANLAKVHNGAREIEVISASADVAGAKAALLKS